MDLERFKSDIENAPFQVAFTFDDTDDVLWAWQSLFDDICNTHAPRKEVKIKSQAPPWMTNEIRIKMNRRFKLFKLAVASKCPIQGSEYKRAQNDVTRSIRLAKASYFSNLFKEVESSSAYWNLVNKATKPNARKSIGPIRRDDGSLALTDEDKANVINSFFATVGDKLSSLLPPPLTSQATGHRCEVPPLFRATINQKQVTEKIGSIQVKKSAGPDNVNPKLLKLAGNVIVPSLTRLYQHSLEDETVFSQWKSARVTPIHKGDDEIDPANYRPISLLSIPSKILESVVNDALVTHVFASNDLASDRQWAFRKGFSTELLLTQLTELWRKEVDKGKAVAVAFIDFKKAFDCVQHEQLLTKLQRNFGILGPLHNWLKSYLSNRLQYTVVNGVKSKMQSVSVGIPQGSVLGPTLFALYISDLPSSVPSGETYLFADDTTIYCVAENGDQAIHQLNKALKELYSWCLNNRLTPHPKKSEAMLLSKTNTVGPTPSVTIGGCLVKLVNKSRLLGVTVDDRLTWSPHLSEVKKSFANKLNLLRKSKFLPKSVLEQFYFSIILPSITYGLVIWANGSNSELFRSIDKLHGRAAKLIYNLGNDTSYEDALKTAKWHSLAYIYKVKLFKLMHNAYNDRLPVPLSDNIVTMRSTEYSLRRSENIAIPRFQSRYLEQSVSYRGAILWNAIASRHPDITRTERWTLDSRLNKIKVLKDFHFKATSASTANFSNDDFIYF